MKCPQWPCVQQKYKHIQSVLAFRITNCTKTLSSSSAPNIINAYMYTRIMTRCFAIMHLQKLQGWCVANLMTNSGHIWTDNFSYKSNEKYVYSSDDCCWLKYLGYQLTGLAKKNYHGLSFQKCKAIFYSISDYYYFSLLGKISLHR